MKLELTSNPATNLMKPMRLLALAQALVATGPAMAQSGDDLVRLPPTMRIEVQGTYGGTMKGTSGRIETQPGRTWVTETLDCQATITLFADGTRTLSVDRYKYEVSVESRTPQGMRRTITRFIGDPQNGRPSQGSMSVWVTKTRPPLVTKDVWSNGYAVTPAVVQHEVQRMGTNGRWQAGTPWNEPNTRTMWCHPRVLWLGNDGRGSGKLLEGSYQGPDANDKRPWVNIDVSWNLTPIR